MSANPTQSRAERDQEEALHYRAMARRLADMAMEMAEAVLQDTKASAEPCSASHEPNTPKPDHTIRFERASRTVRRAILLARELAKPLPQLRLAAANPPLDRTAARKRIIRVVEDAIHRRHRSNPRDVETLEADLLDRLDRPELEDDIAARPIDEIIADLARDLGVGFPLDEQLRVWKPRTQQDIATLETRAAARPQPPPLASAPARPRTTLCHGPPHPNGP